MTPDSEETLQALLVRFVRDRSGLTLSQQRYCERVIDSRQVDMRFLDGLLEEEWGKTGVEADQPKLEAIWCEIERNIDVRKRAVRLNAIKRWIGVAAAACAVFVAGYTVSRFMSEPVAVETRSLLAAHGSIGEFELPDGTRVWLNGGSMLTYDTGMMAGDERSVRLNGEGYFEVSHDSERPFRVNMNDMVVEVHGTVFDARSSSYNLAEEDVILEEGSVSVTYPGLRKPQMLVPGQRLCLNTKSRQVTLTSVNASYYGNWRTPKIVFDNATVEEIATTLGRRYNMSFNIRLTCNQDKRLSMTVGNETFEEVIPVLTTLLRARVSVEGRNVTIRN